MMMYILSFCTILGGLSALWFFWDKIVVLFQKKTAPLEEKKVGQTFLSESRLVVELQSKGLRLFLANTAELDTYLAFGDYERISWTDPRGKTWLLAGELGGPTPLQTRFTMEEIRKRKENRRQNVPTKP